MAKGKPNNQTPKKNSLPRRRAGQHPNPEDRAAAQAAFLEVFAETANVGLACRAARIVRSTAYDWRKTDQGFDGAWTVAEESASDRLEAEAFRRAVQGVEKPVYQGGKMVGTIREYSDVLLIFMMKARMPERYRERFDPSAAAAAAAKASLNVYQIGGDLPRPVAELSDGELELVQRGLSDDGDAGE